MSELTAAFFGISGLANYGLALLSWKKGKKNGGTDWYVYASLGSLWSVLAIDEWKRCEERRISVYLEPW